MPIRNAAQQGMDHKNGGVISSTPDIRASRESQLYALPTFPIAPIEENDWVLRYNAGVDEKYIHPCSR